MSPALEVLTPQWPAPPHVRAAFTLRHGGVSAPPFDSLNLGTHVGDEAEAVAENRRRLRAALALPAEPAWLTQMHRAQVLELDALGEASAGAPEADAAVARLRGPVCAVQVADCLPVLFADLEGEAVAAAHAGWRGLAAGVLAQTVRTLALDPARLTAWLGPAIGPAHFEVGAEVRAALGAGRALAPNARGRWQCDLYAVARAQLHALGVQAVHGGEWCVYADAERFFSYRRASPCGRMAALIWMEAA
jgi:polyphenol oxidase